MPGYALALTCWFEYCPAAFWQSGFCAAAGLAPAGTKQSQSICSVHALGLDRGNVHAYCRSAFGTGDAIDGSHSWPLMGSWFGALPGGARPARGTIDSIMCVSVGATGGFALGSPTIFFQVPVSASWRAVMKP